MWNGDWTAYGTVSDFFIGPPTGPLLYENVDWTAPGTSTGLVIGPPTGPLSDRLLDCWLGRLRDRYKNVDWTTAYGTVPGLLI